MNMSNMEWTIRYPFIEAYCPACKTKFLIEFVGPTISVKHCGNLTRMPEKTYEQWLACKEIGKKDRPYSLTTGRFI